MRVAHAPTFRQRWRACQVPLIAILTGVMGLVNVLSAATPSLADRVHLLAAVSPLQVRLGSHLTAVLAGFALLILAASLWRRKRLGWLLTMMALGMSIISHLLKGLDYEEASLAALVGGWLWLLRGQFYAASDRPSVWQGLRALVFAMLFTLAYGTFGFYILDQHFHVRFDMLTALRQTVIMFTQFYDPGLEPLTGFGRYFARSIYVVACGTGLYALFMLLRPVILRQPASLDEQQRATQIVQQYGQSSLAHFTLFSDKAYYFSSGGSLVAFIAKGEAAVALGDPIGPIADRAAVIQGFCGFCTQHGWYPAFYQVLPDDLTAYHASGLQSLCIGHEAIVDLPGFTLSGKHQQNLRNAINRVKKQGYQAHFYQPPLNATLLAELHSVSDAWLTHMHGKEKRFSVGWFDADYLRACTVITLEQPDGTVVAFANLVPEYQRNEATIDLMRYRPDAEHGSMDALFVWLLQWAQQHGYATFNLGLSALAGVGEHSNDTLQERVLHSMYEHLNRFYNFKGLHAFKDKFHPSWSPRYLIYQHTTHLTAILIALIRADSGDDFVRAYLRELVQHPGER